MSDTTRFHRHTRQTLDLAVRDGFTALADDTAACLAFSTLLGHVRGCSPLLRTTRSAPTAVRALANLARHHREFLTDPADWPGAAGDMHAQVHALAHHLLARYPVPALMTSVWFGDDEPANREEQRWWIAHASGQRFRDIQGLPMQLTRRMEHLLIASPPDLPLRAAMRRAEILGLDGPPALVDAVLTTELADDLEHGEFWRSVLHFFIHHWEALGPAKIKPIVDFLYAVRIRPVEFVTDAGPVIQPPPQPAFSIAGRTPHSLQRLVDAWHAELGRRNHAGRSWAAAGLDGFHYREPPQTDDGEAAHWRISELLHSSALRTEGKALRHCVASYEWRCIKGWSSIWAVTRQSGDDPAAPRYTVEVDPRTRTVVQIRGLANSRASGLPRRIIEQWAYNQRLTVAEHA